MKNKTFISLILIFSIVFTFSAVLVFASVENGGDDGVLNSVDSAPIDSTEPSNGNDDVGGGVVISEPNTGTINSDTTNGNDDIGSGTISTQTGGTITSGTGTSNGQDDLNYPASPNNDSTPTGGQTPTGGTGGTSYSSGGSRNISYIINPINASNCPLLKSYMKLGWNNDVNEVTKLQIFLKNIEKLDIDINGIFDQKTEKAVRNFQTKYLNNVMGPWKATTSSGFAYITTLKKINEIACQSSLILNSDELVIINNYLAKLASGEQVIGPSGETVGSNIPLSTSTESVGQNGNIESGVAATAKSSVWSRFWEFIKNLF